MTTHSDQRHNGGGSSMTGASPKALSQSQLSTGSLKRSSSSLTDCCFSISNLVLIVASIVSLVFAAKFLNDGSLYEYRDLLLTLRFRHLVYILVLLPLVLLVPIFNALGAFFMSWRRDRFLSSGFLGLKLFYEIIMAVMVLVALFFVAPSIRHNGVVSQVSEELRRHVEFRYKNDFSAEFLARIQEEYECCDESWYRNNHPGRLPLSCLQPASLYEVAYERTCTQVLASLVSTRCLVIAVCLLAILASLATLMVLDLLELTSRKPASRESYQLTNSPRELTSSGSPAGGPSRIRQTSRPNKPASSYAALNRFQRPAHNRDTIEQEFVDGGEEEEEETDGYLDKRVIERHRMEERDRLTADTRLQQPLLKSRSQQISASSHTANAYQPDDDFPDYLEDDNFIRSNELEDQLTQSKQQAGERSPRISEARIVGPVRMRSSYLPPARPKSPVFVSSSSELRELSFTRRYGSSHSVDSLSQASLRAASPARGILKRSSSSNLRLDEPSDEQLADHERLRDYQHQLARELQTRRSLMNVRFAE